ncbi:MAG TPA: TetR/AcrR family transcriptional regulator [Trebonia sp.]
MTDPAPDVPDHLTIRPPQQERSRRAWERVLDAGVTLLEEAGYEGFTIAAVCEHAQVPPRAVYDRAPTKDALFLAVYEHGMARIKADREIFTDPAHWLGLDATALIEAVVREVTAIFSRHQALLRAVVLISGVHPEVYRRGSVCSRELGGMFTALLRPIVPQVTQPGTDVDTVLRTCYTTMFSALIIRVAYGPGFAADPVDDATFTTQLARMISLYLLTAS